MTVSSKPKRKRRHHTKSEPIEISLVKLVGFTFDRAVDAGAEIHQAAGGLAVLRALAEARAFKPAIQDAVRGFLRAPRIGYQAFSVNGRRVIPPSVPAWEALK